jgi:hypothetical protein
MLRTIFNKLWIISITILISGSLISFAFTNPTVDKNVNEDYVLLSDDAEQDWNDCVQKGASEWGGGCLNYGFSEEKYTVHLVNQCPTDVDLMSCVQRTNERWSCFYRMDMHKNDSLHAYACQGSGKYLKWVRKAGDITTKFPTRKEVNDQY